MTIYDISGSLPRHATKKYGFRELPSGVKRIVIHTTDWDTDCQTLAKYDIGPNHISKDGCPAITYHDVIMKTGSVFHTLDYHEVSWHAGMWNSGSLAVALMYRCTDKEGKDTLAPTDEALKSLYQHTANLCVNYNLLPDNVLGHRELLHTGYDIFKGSKVLRKTCPGLKVDMDLVRVNVAKCIQLVLKEKGFYSGSIDGIFGKNSKKAFVNYQNALRE